MPNPGGDVGGPDGGITDLNQPPAYVEGQGGGPAMPTGGPLGGSDKELDGEVEDIFGIYTDTLWTACAWASLGEPEDAEFQGVICVIAGGLTLAGDFLDLLANDPPQPSYAHPVIFKQRISHPPSVTDPTLEPLRICIQQSLFASVTMQGYLHAIERLQGAQQAGDVTWALIHRGVANLARQQHIVDIANSAAAFYAAGNALKGTKYDIALKSGMGGVKKWITNRDTKASVAAAMEASGMTPKEIERAIAYAETDPMYTGPASTLSQVLAKNAERIFAVAVAFER